MKKEASSNKIRFVGFRHDEDTFSATNRIIKKIYAICSREDADDVAMALSKCIVTAINDKYTDQDADACLKTANYVIEQLHKYHPTKSLK